MSKFQMIDGQFEQTPADDGRKLLSRSTLLVLSGVLLGLGLQSSTAPAMQSSLFLAAGFGMLSFIGLGRFGQIRRRTSEDMERRLRRHIPRAPHVDPRGQRRRPAAIDRQYLTVVRSSHVK